MNEINWEDGGTKWQEEKKASLPVDPVRPRKFGSVDQPTIEALAVAMFLRGPNDDLFEKRVKVSRIEEAEIMYSSSVRGENFEDAFLGEVYDSLREQFCENGRQLIGVDEKGLIETAEGQDANHVEMYKDRLVECYATLLHRKIRATFVAKQLGRRFRNRMAEKLFQKYQQQRMDPRVGPDKALDEFRAAVMQDLADRSNAPIVDCDWFSECEDTVSQWIDMKRNPEKYSGYKCGIKPIDEQTGGFRPGNLTVFVAATGGFKSTMMLNIAYGLWIRGYDVLYVSLEMPELLVKTKLWCRATQKVSFGRVFNGLVVEENDWEEMEKLEKALQTLDPKSDEYKKGIQRLERLKNATAGLDREKSRQIADTALIKSFWEEHKNRTNQIKIINAGQSSKVRPSQLQAWLKENETKFKPHVVIVDYLALVAGEHDYGDRRHEELGDICKYFRQMGKQMNFSVITAAQLKRAAVDRLRKYGMDKPEKAAPDTDDIAGSQQIGDDADDVFMLFREDGGNRLRMFTAKARTGKKDVESGVTLQVWPDVSMIDSEDRIEDTSVRISQMDVAGAMEEFGKTADYLKEKAGKDPEDETPNTTEIFQTPSNAADLDDAWGNGDEEL